MKPDNKTITLTPIKIEQFIDCPHCNQHILSITDKNISVVGGGTWLKDGDTPPGLWDKLTAEQKQPNGFDYELSVGYRPCCGNKYFSLGAMFVNYHIDNLLVYEWFENNCLILENNDNIKNYVATYNGDKSYIPKTWIVEEIITQFGPAHVHTFGPFKLEDESIIGTNGVAACGCGGSKGDSVWELTEKILFNLWDDLRNLTSSKS